MDNKDITTNELAVMVKNGFDSALDNVNKGFKQADERLDQVGTRMDSRMDKLEDNQRAILTRLEDVVYKTELDQLKERVKIIEEAISLSKG